MTWRLLPAACAGTFLFTLTAFAQHPEVSLREVELREVDSHQLQVISGHQARISLAASASFGTEGITAPGSHKQAAAGTASLPLWTYQTRAAQNGAIYTGMMVGKNPASASSATVPTVLVPVILKITQGGKTYTFDPTAQDTGCLGAGNTALALTQSSPLFSNASFTMNGVSIGSTQYADAFLKGEFWNSGGSSSGYHLLLSATTSPALAISVNAGVSGNSTAEVFNLGPGLCGTASATTNPGGRLAVVNINTIDSLVQGYIHAHGLNASQFPFFVTYNAVMSVGSARNLNNCCVLGYHNALGNPGQTYGIAEFEGRNQTVFSGVADVAAASHEVNEWSNDPSGSNPTPAWGNIGQVSGCQSNLEVGDPLSGTLIPIVTLGGFNYHLQEMAFYSWFYGGTSLGAGGKYSSNGTFGGAAKLCPPGGTN